MSGMIVFIFLAGLTAAAGAIASAARRRTQARFLRLARNWKMHYSPRDPFHIANRLAEVSPVAPVQRLIGATDVRISDLIYGGEANGHRYFFTLHYTTGLVGRRQRRRCVMSFAQPRNESGPAAPTSPAKLLQADESLPRLEQYAMLKQLVDQMQR